ncbi:hypothetical protein IFM89_012483 [Coptis chinensis]|uniref:Ammonium transporter AmtB-like domain-containing protein n=1 Tax=Coptis chinensis TaxID=261450 RepID=A0A835I4L1_9MAGN|nr:hypothetical protein IFM89_012483 [Coptis chinensis]
MFNWGRGSSKRPKCNLASWEKQKEVIHRCVWCPDGWLAKLGVIDYSRGAGLLWMGWTGFSCGDPYIVSIDASLAVINTHVCAATSVLVWLFLDILFFRKSSVIGAIQGMITDLVCITPAAGKQTAYASF